MSEVWASGRGGVIKKIMTPPPLLAPKIEWLWPARFWYTMDQNQKESIYAVECDLYPSILANNKLIDTIRAELKKLENGAVGVAKQTERKKKQRLKQGKEKLLAHYTMEKDAMKNRISFAIKKVEDDTAAYISKKESEKRRIDADIEAFNIKADGIKKRLTEEYDGKIENYYSPHIAALYEDGSENCSDDEVLPTYSPTYYAKKAQLDELIAKNKGLQVTIDLAKVTVLGQKKSVKVASTRNVVVSEADKAAWDTMEQQDAIRKKEREDKLAQHRVELQMNQQAKWAAAEEELKKARDAALADDVNQMVKAGC